ncbi:uncharacterized protein LOC134219747 [Armigeres subalbatus]|uniref:uncharacterized protein LOC134219747 n=1 Tax=Armigeres subalbatus TaxID=124917 RepID=UPI002ED573D9
MDTAIPQSQQVGMEDIAKCDKATWTHEHVPDRAACASRDKLSPKMRLKPISQPPKNISPIPEGTKSHDSSLQRQSSVISDSEAVGGGTFRVGLMVAIFSLHWFVSGAIFFIGLFITLGLPRQDHACHMYFIIMYLRTIYWIATYILHERIKPACQKLVNQNYSLYLDMSCYRKAPLQIVSIWNIVLLALQNFIHTLFLAGKHGTDICDAIDDDDYDEIEISPQIFIVIFCGLETTILSFFYIPAIVRLIRSTLPHEEDEEGTPNQTLFNLDEIPINQRLKRQAEQVKILRGAYLKLRNEAAALGVFD